MSAASRGAEANFTGVKNASKMLVMSSGLGDFGESVRVRLVVCMKGSSRSVFKNASKTLVRSSCFGKSAVVLGKLARGKADKGA